MIQIWKTIECWVLNMFYLYTKRVRPGAPCRGHCDGLLSLHSTLPLWCHNRPLGVWPAWPKLVGEIPGSGWICSTIWLIAQPSLYLCSSLRWHCNGLRWDIVLGNMVCEWDVTGMAGLLLSFCHHQGWGLRLKCTHKRGQNKRMAHKGSWNHDKTVPEFRSSL